MTRKDHIWKNQALKCQDKHRIETGGVKIRTKEFSDIKEIHDRFESIIGHLRGQSAKLTVERDGRENFIKNEATQIENIDLPISTNIRNFLEWDTTLLLIEEQTIQTFIEYTKKLFDYLRGIKDQKEQNMELTELLDKKEEDIDMMSEAIRRRDQEIKLLKEQNGQILAVVKKLSSKPQVKTETIPYSAERRIGEQEESSYEDIFKETIVEEKKIRPMKCRQCGRIMQRKTNAELCVECEYVSNPSKHKIRPRGRPRKDAPKYDRRGEEMEEEADEASEGVSDSGYADEPEESSAVGVLEDAEYSDEPDEENNDKRGA